MIGERVGGGGGGVIAGELGPLSIIRSPSSLLHDDTGPEKNINPRALPGKKSRKIPLLLYTALKQ